MDIETAFHALSQRRPVFHSEADFQHALAWQIGLLNHEADIRLEVPAEFGDQDRAFIDMLARHDSRTTYFELKYKTALTQTTHGTEPFRLKRQGAQDQGKYDFLRDIARIETFVQRDPGSLGFAILLTNDPSYWTSRLKVDSIDAEFELSDQRTLTGTLSWSSTAGAGSIKGREAPISLRGRYRVEWRDYPGPRLPGCQPFRYLCFRIES